MAAAKVKVDSEVAEKIVVPEMKTATMKLRIHGDSLIAHAWSEKAKKQIQESQSQKDQQIQSSNVKKKKRPPRDPKAEYEAARYLDSQGRDCIPAVGIKNAIVTAGMRFLGLKKDTLRGVIYIRGDLLPIKFRKRVMRTDSVNIGWPKVADLRYRPEYQDWSVDFEIQFDEEFISPESLLNLIRRAGFSVGLFEWRPEKGGQHGTFEVESKVQIRTSGRRMKKAA